MSKKKSAYLPYPKEQGYRSGNKVSWYYYDKKEDADAAAAAARHNGELQRDQGYDFGYCAPGTVELTKAGEHTGKYEVCIP